jgi:hypothetical protein
MGEISRVTITATTPQTAQYLMDLIVAGRIAASQQPVNFTYSRRLTFRVPTASAGNAFLLKEPKAGLEGIKILPEEHDKNDSGSRMDNETLLGWYVYGSNNPTLLEVIQEY